MILEFLKYCYFWIDKTFEPAPTPICLVMDCPLGAIIRKRRAISFPRGGAHKHCFYRNACSRTNFNYPKNIMTLNSNPKNRMTHNPLLVKVWINMKSYYDFMFFRTVCSSFKDSSMWYKNRKTQKNSWKFVRTKKIAEILRDPEK